MVRAAVGVWGEGIIQVRKGHCCSHPMANTFWLLVVGRVGCTLRGDLSRVLVYSWLIAVSYCHTIVQIHMFTAVSDV